MSDEPMSAQERALFKEYVSQIEARRHKLAGMRGRGRPFGAYGHGTHSKP